MARTSELQDFPGVLRGNGTVSECTVTVEVTTSYNLQGWKDTPIYDKHEITQFDQSLPDGRYQLTVHGTTHEVQLKDGQWTQFP